MPVAWDRALDEAAARLNAAGAASGALAGGETTNEEGWLLQELMRGALGSPNVDSRQGGMLPRELHAALHTPSLQAIVPDLEFAHAVLVLDCEPVDDAPVLDLRIRKGVRRNAVKLAVATSRPSSLDPNADDRRALRARRRRGVLRRAERGAGRRRHPRRAGRGGRRRRRREITALAELLSEAGEDVVILYGERLTHGTRGGHAARALLNVAGRIVSADHEGAGLLELPAGTNGRGLREVGVLPNAAPGVAPVSPVGLDSDGDRRRRPPTGELSALYLLHVDPLRDLPDRRTWRAALEQADDRRRARRLPQRGAVGVRRRSSSPPSPTPRRRARSRTPTGACSACARRSRGPTPCARSGTSSPTSPPASATTSRCSAARWPRRKLFEAVPFYAGMTLDELGGRGVRWTERPAAAGWPAADIGPFGLEVPPHAPTPNGSLRLGTFRSIWAAPEVELSPALKFLRHAQRAELNPVDAERLGISPRRAGRGRIGTARRVNATAVLRTAVPEGSVFLEEGIADDSASELDGGGLVEVVAAVSATIVGLVGYTEQWYIQILKSVVLFAIAVQIVPVVLLAERKLLGRFQHRYGPNRVGPFGMAQPLADIIKLATKEPFQPSTAIGFLYALAPVISLLTALAAFAILPFGDVANIFGQEVGLYGLDVGIGVLYVFAFGAIAFYGLMLGGWASGSKYSFLGAMRAAAQLISYEVAMGLSLVGVLMMAGTLSLPAIVEHQTTVWYIVPQFVGFLIFLVSAFAETNRAPFDLPEADAELVAGYNTEYGGSKFASYFFAEYVNILVVSGIAVTMFLGGWHLPLHQPAGLLRPVHRARQDLPVRVPLRVDPRDAAAAALRPAHELRLEGAAAAGDVECPGDRDRGGGGFMTRLTP